MRGYGGRVGIPVPGHGELAVQYMHLEFVAQVYVSATSALRKGKCELLTHASTHPMCRIYLLQAPFAM